MCTDNIQSYCYNIRALQAGYKFLTAVTAITLKNVDAFQKASPCKAFSSSSSEAVLHLVISGIAQYIIINADF